MRKILPILLVCVALVFAKEMWMAPQSTTSVKPYSQSISANKNKEIGFNQNPLIKGGEHYSTFGAGGPDAFGYRYIDNDTTAPNAPTFQWINISSVGTLVTGLGDDNVVGPYSIGFSLPYYWYRVSSFYIGSNGYIAFGDNGLEASPFHNIPDPARPNNLVAPLLSDLNFSVGTPSCYYWTNAANDTCIITYQNLQWWNMPTSCCSLQIILARPDSSITFQYKRIVGTPNGGWAGANSGNRTGIENFLGTVGLQYVNGTTPPQNDIHDNLAVKFYPPVTSSYQAYDVSIWNAVTDNSGGFFTYKDSTRTLWANVKNSGNQTVIGCSVFCRIRDTANVVVYADTVVIASMTPGQQDSVVFTPAWVPTAIGLYSSTFQAKIPNDIYHGNDSVVIETHVVTYPTELAYDDGVTSGGSVWSGTSGGYGVKFTPPGYPCRITGAKVNLSTNNASPVNCTIYVFLADGPDGSPGTVIAKRGIAVSSVQSRWYRIILDQTITDGSFFVGVTQNDSGLSYNMDNTPPISGQSWEYTGVWAPYRSRTTEDVMFRALVGYTPLENDAVTEEITLPTSMIAPNTAITPQALIANFGTLDQPNIPVVMKIDSAGTNVYTGNATVSLNSGFEGTANFTPQWTSGPSGVAYDITVYTNLGNDQDRTNDTLKGITSSFTVITLMRAKFLAVNPIIDGNVDNFEWSDANKYDVSDLYGYGNGTPHRAGSAYLWMKHDSNFVYVATTMPYATNADDRDQVGLYLDENRDGSWAADSSEGNYWLVHYETGGVDSVIYRAWIPGTPSPSTWRFGPVPGAQMMSYLYNGYMNFEAKIPIGSEKYQIHFAPYLNADTMRLWMFGIDNPNSDYYGWWPQSMSGSSWQDPYAYGVLIFERPYYDVGVQGILAPAGSVAAGPYVIPKAIIKNCGLATTTFPVIFSITEQKASDYVDTAWISLGGMQTDTVEFTPWLASNVTIYQTEVKVEMAGDMFSGNNSITGSFEVIPGTWTPEDVVPAAPDLKAGKFVKDGGCFTTVGEDIYGFPGNKSCQFYKYEPGTKGWITLESIPYGVKPTDPTKINKKKIGKGAALCYDGTGIIYATKGNGTRELWAYDILTDTWVQKAFVPVPKALKGGTSIAYLDGKLYLLAGGQKKTDLINFYSYDPLGDTLLGTPWTPLGLLTLGPNIKIWKDGASLAELGGVIYALKTNDKANLFYGYDILGNVWNPVDSMPVVESLFGKSKKVIAKDGAAMVSSGSAIYAIKGGGANVFWKFNGTTWSKLDSIPRLHKKSVPKTGAALACANEKVWLMKGNNTQEFWSYGPLATTEGIAQTPIAKTNSAVMTEKTTTTLRFSIDAIPNPFNGLTTIRYTVPVSGRVSIKFYNTTGRLIETLNDSYLTTGRYTTTLTTKDIASGIYFLRYESNTNRAEIKLIVQ